MDKFYYVKNCERCGVEFGDKILRIQSWFNDEVICSLDCNKKEKEILKFLGNKKFDYEDCGILPIINTIND